MKTTRPPGQSGSKMPAAPRGLPEHSKTTSAPQPSVAARTVSARFWERTLTGVIGPRVAASASLASSTSETKTRAQPAARSDERGDEADRARADHDADVAGLHRRLGGAVDADGERLDHRGLGEGDVVGELEGEELGVDDGRAEDAVDRRRRPEADGRVDVVDAEARGAAVGVGDARLHADAVADLQGLDLGAGLDDDARGLVAEDHRLA